jgi:hypothetical protein
MRCTVELPECKAWGNIDMIIMDGWMEELLKKKKNKTGAHANESNVLFAEHLLNYSLHFHCRCRA